jgi:hypothetical protein
VFALSVIALSVTMAWLYWRTNGGLPVVMLLHAAVNNLGMIFSSSATSGVSRVAWITLGLLWGFALYFLWQMRPASSPRH